MIFLLKKHTLLLIILTISGLSFAQPANDICANRTIIGNLPTPGACTGGLQDGAAAVYNGTTINANPESPYPSVSGSCVGSPQGTSTPANDVWYEFTTTGTTVNISMSGLSKSNLVVWQGTCGALTAATTCLVTGNSGNGSVSFNTIVGQTYYVQVSSDKLAASSNGNFTLSIDNDIDCDNCLMSSYLTANPTPTSGSYIPGQVVQFCYTVTDFQKQNSNWFHGVQITFGSGWTGTLTNITPATTCGKGPPGNSPTGVWSYYPSGLGTVNGQSWGPGFYFKRNNVTSPNLGYGDEGSNNCNWTFCWELTVSPTCNPGSDLSVTVNTSGDGESGGWANVACTPDNPVTSMASGFPLPIVTNSNDSPVCPGQDVNLTSTTAETGVTFSWTGPNGFTSNLQNPTLTNVSAADAGDYIVGITKNGCTGYDTTTVSLHSGVNLVPTANSPLCENDTLNLTALTIPSGTYSWTGPNGFSSNLQNPSVNSISLAGSGDYIVSGTSAGCSGVDTVNVIVNPIPVTTAGSNSPVCENDTLNLTATTVAGATYSWSGPNGFTSALQNPNVNGVVLADAGDYIVTTTLNGCTYSDTITVVINPVPVFTVNGNTPLCENDTLNLTATNVATATYAWTGPNGFASALQNPNINGITLAGSGDYIAQATVNGCSTFDTITILVNPIPVTTASSNSPVCENDTLNLTATTVAGATYAWTGPNSFSSALQNPNINGVSLAADGDYILTTTLNGCTFSDTITVVINPVPVFSVNGNTPLCENDTLNLTATNVATATYAWTGLNGFTSAIQNPNINGITLAGSGDYIAQATVNGCSTFDTITVLVNPIPFTTAGSNSPVCENDTLNLTATTVAGATYSWSGPNGFSSALQNPNINGVSLAADGDYIVTTTLNGCTFSDTITVVINPVPVFSVNGNTPLCENDTLNLTATNVATATYDWTGPNGFTSALQNPNINGITLAGSGNYIAQATVNGCSTFDTVSVLVNPIPVTTASSNSPVCENDTLNLTATTVAGATYAWTGPNSFSSALQNPNINGISLAADGDYIVTTTLNGCTFSDTISVVVNSIPYTTTGNNSPICEYDTLNLTATTVAGATYSWSGPNGFTSNIQNPNINGITLAGGGDYIATITLNGCSSNDTTNAVINSAPVYTANGNLNLCENDTLNFTVTNVVGGIFSWTGPNGFSSALQNPSINNITPVNSGSYILEVTANGCSKFDTLDVVVTATPITTANSNSPICESDTLNLTATTVAGASYSWTGPNGFTSSLQNPNVNGVILADNGDYIITTTLNGCTYSDTVTVVVNPIPFTIAGSNSPLCENDTLNLTATTVASATYSWTGPNGFTSALQNPNINGVGLVDSGYYIVSTFLNGCSFSDTVFVNVNPTPTVTVTSNTPVCEYDTIYLTSNTVPGASYSWTGPNGFTSNLQNPSSTALTSGVNNSGTYFLNITLNGCSNSNSTYVNVTATPATSPIAGNTNLCEGDTLNLSSFSSFLATVSWTGPNGFTSNLRDITINGVGLADSGVYIVQATEDGCSAWDTVNVVVNPTPITTAGSNSPLCENDTLNLTATTVVGATYSWTGPNGFTSALQNPNVNGVVLADAGDYIVTTTLNGCTYSDTVAVVVNPIPVTTAGSNSPLCEDDTLNLTATTVAGATYSWTGPNGFSSALQNPNVNGVVLADNGDYIVTTTLNGCTYSDTVAVVVNPIPVTTAGSNSPLCENDTLNLTATTVAGATYSWTGPNGFSSALQNPNVNGVVLADNGDYIVTTTLNGCTYSDTVAVVINPIPVTTAGSNSPLCENDTLNLTATTVAGATYAWTGPNGFTSALQNPNVNGVVLADNGDYIVTTTLNGCTYSDTVAVVVNPIPVTTAGGNNILCVGNDLNLTATNVPGATFSWTGPNGFSSSLQSPTITNVTLSMSGDYIVEVSLNGCSSTDTLNVIVDVGLTVVASANTPVCEYDTINLSASNVNGATYSWAGPNGFTSNSQDTSITNLSTAYSGDYIVTADLAGCLGRDTIAVIVNPTPITTPSSNSPVCENDTLNLTTTNVAGASFSWTGPNGFTSALQNPNVSGITLAGSGYYIVTSTLNGCVYTDTTTVMVNPIPVVTLGSNSPVCENGTLNLTSTTVAGAAYSWSGPNGFISINQNPTINNISLAGSGNYIINVGLNGCSYRDTIAVTVNPNPVFTITSNSPVCENDSIKLTSTAVTGGTYSWTGPNGFTSALQNPFITPSQLNDSGDYILSVDLNGCVINDTTRVQVNPIPTTTTSNNTPICEGNTISLNTSNIAGATYSWSGPNGFSDNTNNPSIVNSTRGMAGDYYVTISLNGCNYYDTTNVVIDTIISAAINSATPFCYNGNSANLTAVNPGGVWSGTGITNAVNGTFDPQIAGSGNHTITYISKGTCPDTQTIVINVTYPQNIQIALDATEGCPPLTVNATTLNTGNLSCSWFVDNDPMSDLCSGFNNTFYASGCYDVRLDVVDSNGCTNSRTFTDTICVYPQPVASFTYPYKKYTVIDNIVNFNNNSTDADNYLWDFMGTATSNLINPTYNFPTTPGTYQVCLEAISNDGCIDSICQVIEIFDAPFFNVPNAFTPNNDGYNDVFTPIISEFNIETYDFYIFNRWGNLIFSTKELNTGWDGTHQGEPVEIGVYVWKVVYKEYDDVEIKSFIGHINLVR